MSKVVGGCIKAPSSGTRDGGWGGISDETKKRRNDTDAEETRAKGCVISYVYAAMTSIFKLKASHWQRGSAKMGKERMRERGGARA